MAKAATTMIFVGADRVARLDLGDTPPQPILFSWQSARLPGQALEQSVESALDMNGRCGRNVWVLCEGFWTQVLSLSAAAVKGLGGVQLERVLGFELESLSGLGAGESHVAFVPCESLEPQPGQQAYWVTQVASDECRQVQQLVRNAGGKLRGLLHPRAEPGQGAIPAMEGDALDAWLIGWARRLGKSDCLAPVIRPAEPPRSPWRQVGVSIGLAIVTLAACLVHGSWMKGQSEEASRNLKVAELPRQQVIQLDRGLAQAQEELRQLSVRRANRTSTDPAAALAGQRRRVAALLAALSGLSNESRVVTGLKPDAQGGQTVEGLCLSPESADDLAVGLGRRLAGAGWKVRGAQKTARLISPDGGPWEFRILLAPAGQGPPIARTGDWGPQPGGQPAKPGDLKTLTTASASSANAAGGPPAAGGP